MNIFSKLVFTGERASMKDRGGINLARYVYALNYAQNKNLLEIGFGSGNGANYLAKHGVKNVLAVDYNSRAVDFANNYFHSRNLCYKKTRVEDLKLKNKFDTIISFEVIEHINKPDIMLRKVRSLLNKNGVFLVSTPNRAQSSYDGNKPTNPYHVREYYSKEFDKLLKKYFKSVKLYGILLKGEKRGVEENIQKTFRWRVAAFLTRKRWIRRIVNYLPEAPKRLFTGEKDLKLSYKDFEFSLKNTDEASYLIAVCKL